MPYAVENTSIYKFGEADREPDRSPPVAQTEDPLPNPVPLAQQNPARKLHPRARPEAPAS